MRMVETARYDNFEINIIFTINNDRVGSQFHIVGEHGNRPIIAPDWLWNLTLAWSETNYRHLMTLQEFLDKTK